MNPKHISEITSRRRTSKPTVSKENENPQRQRTAVYQSNPSEYNYGLPQTSAPPTPRERRSGEPRIWVCVRKRPLTPAEERRQETDVVTSAGQSCVVHESRAAVDLTHYERQHRFYFDHVFGEDSSNEEVYLRTAFPLVRHMLQGGSATCFAYGQTGAGKTHTMLGISPAGGGGSGGGSGGPGGRGDLGLYALAAQDLFSILSSSPALTRLSVFVSFFEIYCGQLYDLLDHRKRLFAREDGQRNVHIAGLCHKRVDSVHSLLQMISRGTDERSQGSSGVNPVSSRSHALLQIQLRGSGQDVHGRMWFVDLAGSERASDSRDPDRRSRIEGAEINQSLLALKECIRSLDQEQGHTPFRQSKLTQVLKDSFIGDSLTCMIANISPGHSSTEHTLNTLRYADRVKELKGQRGQRRGGRGKNIPSPRHILSQCRSSSAGRGRYRGSSPPKKPRTTSTVPTSPIRTHVDCTFLSSTPKNHKCDKERRGRQMFEQISPVQSQLRRRHAKLWSQSTKKTLNTEFCQRKLGNQQAVNQNYGRKDIAFRDQEKKRHLKLYHQHLQQFDPLLTSSDLPSLNTSTTSSEVNSHAVKNMLTSSVDTADILGPFKARTNQVQPSLANSELNLVLNNGKSRDLKGLVDETGVILRNNWPLENRGAKWAWVTDNKEISAKLCDSQAPAERPLSPAAEHSDPLLTLFDLNCSKMSPNSKEVNQCNECSANMAPLRFSMLEVDQEPGSVSFLQPKPTTSDVSQEAAVPVCSMQWEPEEGAEEFYLEVPRAIRSSMIPWAVRFYSQQHSDQPISALNNEVHNNNSSGHFPHNRPQGHKDTTSCPLSPHSTTPPPGHSGNSSSAPPKSERGEKSQNPSTSEDWTSGAHWQIIQAHLVTLKELELLSHREGTLLIQQPDMAFVEYVQQLEQIMRRKALCVRSMISHLQPYLKTSHAPALT
ncbi:uncharacterized protein [Eucyclogobius newberryi]|uniref:uncharacterized protein n=1 Tax=Eucyclogobius newberryi TaxID=166745 RepID=UPI003B5CE3FD